jgi:hypothetical protein
MVAWDEERRHLEGKEGELPVQDGELDVFCCQRKQSISTPGFRGRNKIRQIDRETRDEEMGDEPSTPPEPDPGRRALLRERRTLLFS